MRWAPTGPSPQPIRHFGLSFLYLFSRLNSPSFSDREFVAEPLEFQQRIQVKCARPVDEFRQAEVDLPSLHFGNVGLRAVKTVCEFRLREASHVPSETEPFTKAVIGFMVNGAGFLQRRQAERSRRF